MFTSKPGIYAAKRIAATAAGLRLVYHVSKLTLRVPLVFTKKQGIYAAKLMLRLRPAFVNRTYYTITPRSGLNKTTHMPTKLWLPNFGLANGGWEPNSPNISIKKK